jgi:NAD(P)H dehydrogenase (quinone)
MAKVAIVYYSTFGHTTVLAEAMLEGVENVEGVEGAIYQVAETLSKDALEQRKAAPKQDYPLITPEILAEYDGVLFGFPTQFGAMPPQMAAFFDSCGSLWAKGALVGKPAGVFVSSGIMGGGVESSPFTTLPFLAHQGMLFVPLGYRTKLVSTKHEVHGGSSWGAGTLSGITPDMRQPTFLELECAMVQGQSFAEITKKLAA